MIAGLHEIRARMSEKKYSKRPVGETREVLFSEIKNLTTRKEFSKLKLEL
ncbi:MAG: hypothetical protein QMC93_00825 [Patescibacteria group bacterium]|nr:hypothetical protein [Patescibacteria group bacterium]